MEKEAELWKGRAEASRKLMRNPAGMSLSGRKRCQQIAPFVRLENSFVSPISAKLAHS